MSSIPNSAMRHAKAFTAPAVPAHGSAAPASRFDRTMTTLREVPNSAWLAGAAAIGLAGLATVASGLRGKPTGKGAGKARRKSGRGK